jgi:3,4-dihydroxy 2-butanone 4-phosphate synthase/GTP cyclohydrolase II
MSNAVELALLALLRGNFVVVADDASRENEGDLIIAAEKLTPQALAFMLRHTSGVICVALTDERADELELPLMVPENSESQRTAFTVTVDLRHGTTTGISAADRSAAIRALAEPGLGADAFLRPGHVFPLRARAGGVLERRGHTEAAVDLARLAGFEPAGALCEIVDEDGELLRGAELERFAQRHRLPFLHIAELVEYRREARGTQPSVRAPSFGYGSLEAVR